MSMIKAASGRISRPSAAHAALTESAIAGAELIDRTALAEENIPTDTAARRIPTPSTSAPDSGEQGQKAGENARASWHAHMRRGLPGRIARELASAILSGNYKPGDRLFGEIAFSDRLNVSRTTYRQAIQILATKGMVSSNPRRGTIVNARSMWHFLDPGVMNLLLETGPDLHAIEELRELLLMLAPKAAALAAERRTDEMLVRMQAGIDSMKRVAQSADQRHRACQDFYLAVFLASGNSYVISLAPGLAAALDVTMAFRGAQAPDNLEDHLRLFAAITRQDAMAAEQASHILIERTFLDVSVSN